MNSFEMTPSIFTYRGIPLRTAGTADSPEFVAKDACDMLTIPWRGQDTLASIPAAWKALRKFRTPGGEQELITITEAGLYKLAFRSTKEEAEMFTNWVAGEVLPTIRKTGKYEAGSTTLALPQTFAEALRALADTVEEKERLTLALADAEPKVAFFNAVTDSKSAIEMAAVAKVLAVPGFGRTKLFAFLRDRKILRKNNQPMQEYVDRGYFRVVEQKWNTPDGEVRVTCKTLVFQKGLDYIRMILPQ